ncbi:MAG: PepSY domain-containing protein, partial [Opitutaceae bacterium]
MTFRKSVFWLHLALGLLAGLVIAIMSFTGAAIAFDQEIIAYAERDILHVTPPRPDAPRLPVSEMLESVKEFEPDAFPQGITISADPTQVVQFTLGREFGTVYVDPYKGDVRAQGAKKWRAFFQTMEN